MKTKQKLYVALAMLLLAVVGLYAINKKQEANRKAHAADTAAASLPTLGLSKEQVEQLTKLTIQNADKSNVTLEKKGDAWELSSPVGAKANAANVRSLLDNLSELKASGTVDTIAFTSDSSCRSNDSPAFDF
jgi:hypothetical protein